MTTAIIADSNIIIAALIKDSINRKLIVDLYPHVYYPEGMVKEIEKYKELIKKKASLKEEEFYQTYEKLFKYIKIIPSEDLLKYKDEATKSMKDIDPEDHLLLAAAFCFAESCIWSNDPHLKKQTRIKNYTTAEIMGNMKAFLKQ